MLVLGIDEAGRGPCIGSMFIVGAMFDERDLAKLKSLGVKDSKLLVHKKRVELAEKIKKIAKKIKIVQVRPREIDKAVESKNGLNLNWLEALKQAEIINELKPDKAIIDCPSPNIKKYGEYLLNLLKNKKIELIVEHKADYKYIPVGAASIIAKVEREKEVKKIEKFVGESIGSGYSSNPICQEFIKHNIDKYPEIFRKSWMTYKAHKTAKSQKKLDEF
ncbi:MAG: ribonuclease HII [Nanoarchaeota archaeon]